MGYGVDIAPRLRGREAVIEDRGSFIASGMIAGEAIMGIILAATFLGGFLPSLAYLTGETSSVLCAWGGWISLAAFAAIATRSFEYPLQSGAVSDTEQ